MMISMGSITDLMLYMNYFSSYPQISSLLSKQSRIFVHLKVIQADITSVFSCTTLLSNVSSWIRDQHCISKFLLRSAYFISQVRYASSSAILSPSFSLFIKSLRKGHSVFRLICASSHKRLHSQQNSHKQRHFIWEHPTFFSMGCLHLGHSRVLFLIHEELAYSELRRAYHLFTFSQGTGKCGSFRHLQQYSSPQGQVTVLISIMFGFIQKYGHFSLGQQQISLFCMAQLMQIFFLFNSLNSGAMASTNPLRIGALGQGGQFMQEEKILPFHSSCLMQLVQHGLQQKWEQKPEEQRVVWLRQTQQSPSLIIAAWLWLLLYLSFPLFTPPQSSEKYKFAIFYQFH